MRPKPSGLFVKESPVMPDEKSTQADASDPIKEKANPTKVGWKEALLGGNNPADKSMNWVFACFGFWIVLATIAYVVLECMPSSILDSLVGLGVLQGGCVLIGLIGLTMQTFATILTYRASSDATLITQNSYAALLCFLSWIINGIIGVAFVMGGLLPWGK